MTFHVRDAAQAAPQVKVGSQDDEILSSGMGARPDIARRAFTLEDFQTVATRLHGADFACWIVARKNPLEALFLLCHEAGVALLPRREPGLSSSTDPVPAVDQSENDDSPIERVIQLLFSRYRSEFTRPLG